MTRHKAIAFRLRWVFAALYLIAFAAAVWWIAIHAPDNAPGLLGTPLVHPNILTPTSYHATAIALLFIFLATQWLFLCPRGRLKIQTAKLGRPMRTSIAIAALMAMLLSCGLIATAAELLGFTWQRLFNLFDNIQTWWPVWLIMLIIWLLWTVIFAIYWRGQQQDHYTQSTKILRALIAGSILELLIASPVLAFRNDPEECYCARPSYTGLVFGTTALLWAFGPGVVFLFLREKHRIAATKRDISGDDSL